MSTSREPPLSSRASLLEAAISYVRHGLSLMPIRADGTKMPAFEKLPRRWDEEESRWKATWSPFKTRLPTLQELQAWFDGTEVGLAIIGGAVSGGLEIIDCDNWRIAMQWRDLVKKAVPGLIGRLAKVKTPRPGLHVYYRCAEFGGNRKLACIPDPGKDGKSPKAVIEVKGEAGYCLAPPSPAACHPTGRPYMVLYTPDLTHVPTISPDERAALLACAVQLNAWSPPARPAPTNQNPQHCVESLPGNDFNLRACWADILVPHQWKFLRSDGDSEYWCRPGKLSGVSAHANFEGTDLLYVFSSNAPPFESGKAYSKFSAYTLLNHGGDFSAAARDLAMKGYGRMGRTQRSRPVVADSGVRSIIRSRQLPP